MAAADVRLGWLIAGHYRRVRRFWAGSPFGILEDARVIRRRLARRAGRLDPAPPVPTYVAAARLLQPRTPGFRALASIDAALSADLHTPRAVAALHLALRAPELAEHDRRVLLSAACRLLGMDTSA